MTNRKAEIVFACIVGAILVVAIAGAWNVLRGWL